jgi:Glycosyl transferases group 1
MAAPRPSSTRFVLVSADEQAILADLHAEPEWPRQDVVELARTLDAELLSYADLRGASWITRSLARWVGKPVALAWLAFRRGGGFYFANAENVALPLALLLKIRRSATLAFIGHRMTTPLKTRLVRAFGLLKHVRVVFCYSPQQESHLVQRLGLPVDRVRRIHFQVDQEFFAPGPVPAPGTGVLSVGRDIPVTVVASSPWSSRADQTANRTIPANVTIRRNLSSTELRELYRRAAVVVVPLVNVDWPAGVTALLEAQACSRPVVVSASDGLVDSIDPGTAVVVPCADPGALRDAVLRLVDGHGEAAALGERGRTAVMRARTLAHWVDTIARACGAAGPRPHDDQGAAG